MTCIHISRKKNIQTYIEWEKKKNSTFKKEFLQEFSPVCLVCLLFLVQYSLSISWNLQLLKREIDVEEEKKKEKGQSLFSFLKKLKSHYGNVDKLLLNVVHISEQLDLNESVKSLGDVPVVSCTTNTTAPLCRVNRSWSNSRPKRWQCVCMCICVCV